ncbi:LLM class flavin-dependent oxidoreductase [Streptomyces sp. NPDC101118]|uniref:LLM class flavin-dependent oxidoreductase n=1 Tax=Streptomyces sp. NPDC101118 TaxID=3366109 RepID=UPI003814F5A2
MDFGINFFPAVSPAEKAASRYFAEALALVELAEDLGFGHVKAVEHYFFPYGGYSPDPVAFLAAAAARTSRIRLVTGAVIPAFSHPVQLAGKLAMLDNLAHGRLDVGVGRGFLPGEFEAFGIPMEESRDRFTAGVEAVRRLWSEEEVRVDGPWFRFGPVTLLPRPYQRPHPPLLVAAAVSPESCRAAGAAGHGLMLVPSVAPRETVRSMIDVHREAWRAAGHPAGAERVHLTYDCFVHEDGSAARAAARAYAGRYQERFRAALTGWGGADRPGYEGYRRLVEQVGTGDPDAAVRADQVLAGTPDEVLAQLTRIRDWFGDAAVSLNLGTGAEPPEEAERTVRLLGKHVLPAFPEPS